MFLFNDYYYYYYYNKNRFTYVGSSRFGHTNACGQCNEIQRVGVRDNSENTLLLLFWGVFFGLSFIQIISNYRFKYSY